MIPAIIKLRGDVNELQEKVLDLEAKIDMMHAHVENLIERTHLLENPSIVTADCNCGWGGSHDPDNARCALNQALRARSGPEQTFG